MRFQFLRSSSMMLAMVYGLPLYGLWTMADSLIGAEPTPVAQTD